MSAKHPSSNPSGPAGPSVRKVSIRGMLRWRRWLKPFLSRNGSPEAIAGGLAIGSFIAFTPTFGIQLLLAYMAATLCRASRAAAIVPVWITNPLSLAAVYASTYSIGLLFVDGPSVGHVRRQLTQLVLRWDAYDTFDLPARFRAAASMGVEVFIPMLIGGVLVGAVCAGAVYPLSLWSVRRLRARRDRRRAGRRLFPPLLKHR
jgi:uncharacterized protein